MTGATKGEQGGKKERKKERREGKKRERKIARTGWWMHSGEDSKESEAERCGKGNL